MKCVDSLIPDSHFGATIKIDDPKEFLNAYLGRSKLVWCKTEQVEAIRTAAESLDFTVFVDCSNITQIRRMNKNCLIVTDEMLMIGVDYRSVGGIGVDLLLRAPLSCEAIYN